MLANALDQQPHQPPGKGSDGCGDGGRSLTAAPWRRNCSKDKTNESALAALRLDPRHCLITAGLAAPFRRLAGSRGSWTVRHYHGFRQIPCLELAVRMFQLCVGHLHQHPENGMSRAPHEIDIWRDANVEPRQRCRLLPLGLHADFVEHRGVDESAVENLPKSQGGRYWHNCHIAAIFCQVCAQAVALQDAGSRPDPIGGDPERVQRGRWQYPRRHLPTAPVVAAETIERWDTRPTSRPTTPTASGAGRRRQSTPADPVHQPNGLWRCRW